MKEQDVIVEDNQTDGYRKLIRSMGAGRRDSRKLKAEAMREYFEENQVSVQSDLYIAWVNNEPRQTTSTPFELMQCDNALVGIYDEWQRRQDWHAYWKDALEYELSKKS